MSKILFLFDLDQTLVNSDHRIKFLENGSQDITAFRRGDPMQDLLLQGECLDFWHTIPRQNKGILTSRVLCKYEKRGLRNLGLCPDNEHVLALSRPENSPLSCSVLKSANLARVLRRPHNWRKIVFFEDSERNLQAIAKTCEAFGIAFKGYLAKGDKALDWKPQTA